MTSTGRHLDETQAEIPNAPNKRADLFGRSHCERHQGQQPKGRTQRPDIWAHRSRMGSAEEKSTLDRGVVPHMGIVRMNQTTRLFSAQAHSVIGRLTFCPRIMPDHGANAPGSSTVTSASIPFPPSFNLQRSTTCRSFVCGVVKL